MQGSSPTSVLDERGREEKRSSKHAMCPEAGSRVQCSQAEKTKERLNLSSCFWLHREHKTIIIPWRCVPETEGITDTRSTVSPLYREFCVSQCTSLMNVCCLEILYPHNYCPNIALKLAAWLGPTWLRDVDNSDLFLSTGIPLAISISWSHCTCSKILIWLWSPRTAIPLTCKMYLI